MDKIRHSFDEKSALIEITGDSQKEYFVKFFYFTDCVYEHKITTNSWVRTSVKSNCVKIFDNNDNLIFQKFNENQSLPIWKISENSFLQTIPNEIHSTIHTRCLPHNGCVIDLGSYIWEWSSFFIGKKRIIGIEPFGEKIQGTELFKGIIGPFDGKTYMSNENIGSSIFSEQRENMVEIEVLSWKSFCKLYKIDKISIIKINIEGSEYPLLSSMDLEDYKKIDQIVISFHDWKNPDWIELTKSALYLLQNNGFEIVKTDDRFNWYLALNKN